MRASTLKHGGGGGQLNDCFFYWHPHWSRLPIAPLLHLRWKITRLRDSSLVRGRSQLGRRLPPPNTIRPIRLASVSCSCRCACAMPLLIVWRRRRQSKVEIIIPSSDRNGSACDRRVDEGWPSRCSPASLRWTPEIKPRFFCLWVTGRRKEQCLILLVCPWGCKTETWLTNAGVSP